MERTRTDTSLRQTQSALARTRFTSGLRRVDLFQSRIASGWAESACSRRPVALAHFDTTLSRSDIASTQTDIEMTISNSLWRSINSRDTRFFDITLSPSDITLTQSDIVSSHPEISWSWQRFTPGLRQFIPFCRRLSSGRSDIAPWPTAVSRSRTRPSLRRSDGGPASRSRAR